MNANVLRILQGLGNIATTIGAVNLTGLAPFLPVKVAAVLLAAGPVAGAFKQFMLVLGDYADDGEKNDSFTLQIHPLAWFSALLAATLLLGSCALSQAPDGSRVLKADLESLQAVGGLIREVRGTK